MVPWDKNVWVKENEKVEKYFPLARDVCRVHVVETRVVPIVVGALAVVTTKLVGYLKELGISNVVGGLQTSTIVGAANILRKTINI